jgi:hypothetical protein
MEVVQKCYWYSAGVIVTYWRNYFNPTIGKLSEAIVNFYWMV